MNVTRSEMYIWYSEKRLSYLQILREQKKVWISQKQYIELFNSFSIRT